MDEQLTEAPHAADTNKEPASALTHYDSNPFTTAWTGVQKLIKTNAHTVIGVALFNILLFVVMGVALVSVFLAIVAYVIRYNSDLPDYSSSLGFLDSMSDTSIYLTWGIGAAVWIFVTALTQSLQLHLTVAGAKGIALKFGALLKASIRSVLPILGYVSLVILALLASGIAFALLGTLLGFVTLLLVFVVILAFMYVALRLSYVTYCIVDKHLGPVAAIKDSWTISQGHLIETIGSASVATLIFGLPSLILTALARASEEAPTISGIFSLLELVLIVVLVIGAAMSMAERYVQVQAVANKQLSTRPLSAFNYLAIVAAFFLAGLMNVLTPQSTLNNPRDLRGIYNSSDNESPDRYDERTEDTYDVNYN